MTEQNLERRVDEPSAAWLRALDENALDCIKEAKEIKPNDPVLIKEYKRLGALYEQNLAKKG